MDEKSDLEIRGEVDLTFQDFLYDVNLWTIISNSKNTEVLRKLVDAYFNSDRIKLPRILICGEGKTATTHAYINSLAIQGIHLIEADFLDSPFGRKFIFNNIFDKTVTYDQAVIVSNSQNMSQQSKEMIWQLLTYKRYYNQTFQQNKSGFEIIHYDGLIILTANKKELVAKELLKQIDICIELEPYEDFQLRQILEQRLKYMKIMYDQESFNLLINSGANKIGNLMQLLKLCIISMMSQDRNKLLKSDIEWAITNYKIS